MKKYYILFLLNSLFVFSQNATDFDASFLSGIGTSTAINAVNIQPDEKILIGGYFSSYNGTTSHNLARLNTNGTIDASFNNMTTTFDSSGEIRDIEILPDGKILVAGFLTEATTLNTTKRIVKLNADGSLDSSFNLGTGFNNFVSDIAIQSDGKIIAVGFFTTINGQNKSRIVRLNSDGSIDTSFDIGTGFNNNAHKVVIQSDGKILVGGGFSSYKGTSANKIIRLNTNGSIDASFFIGSGFNNFVNAIQIQPNGKIIIGGFFTTYDVENVFNLIRLNTDGTSDGAFFTGNGVNNISGSYINSIALQSDGKIVIGGGFTNFGINSAKNLARLESNGQLDASFVTSTGIGSSGTPEIKSIKIQNDGKIVIGGFFDYYRTTNSKNIARLHDVTLSTESFENAKFSIYPNPTIDNFFIEIKLESQLEIFDISGKKVVTTKLESGTNSVSISDLRKGMYLLKLQNQSGSFTKKVVKE